MEGIFDFNFEEYQEVLEESVDNEVPSQKQIINTNNAANLDIFSIYLDCNGDTAGCDDDSIFRQDLQILFNHLSFEIPDEIELFDFILENDYENFDQLIAMARVNIQKIQANLLIDSFNGTYFAYRESVTKLLLFLRCNYQDLSDKHLQTLRVSLATFDSMPHFSLVHSAFSSTGNASLSSNYHILHGMLEWRWIYLTILYKIEFMQGKLGSDESDLVNEIKLFIYDLMALSIVKFQKCSNANLIFTSSFICGCVKEMWSLIYEFVNCLQDSSINFWELIAVTIMKDIQSGKNFYENFPAKKILLRSSQPVIVRNSVDQFSIWILSGLINLLKSDASFGYFEELIKNYLKIDQSEENLRVLILMLAETLLTAWSPKSDILMHLWEIFQKKINSPFMIAGQSPNFMQVSNTTAENFLEQIRKQQAVNVKKLNINLSSFSMFIYTLGKMVEKFTEDSQKIQIQRVLGRILAKFPASKLQQLNEMGIHNILKLLITLAISTDFPDIAPKVTQILLQIPLEKPNHQQQVMKGHIVMIILYCENHINITQYVNKLMAQIETQMQRSSASNIFKVLGESLPMIILRNDDIFENGEEVLIDNWIVKHLQSITIAEQDRLYESITKVIQKLQNVTSENLMAIVEKIFNLLIPYARQNFGKTDSIWMPEMTANLCLLSLYHPSLNIQKFETLLKSFLDINSSNFEATIKFITFMMKKCEFVEKLDTLSIMQNWIKFSVLMSGSVHELKEMTKCVMKLSEFQSLCVTSLTQPEQFIASKEPLVTFMDDIGKKYKVAGNQEKLSIIDKVHSYLLPFEKWALPIVQQNAAQKSSTILPALTDETVMRIFTFIAITFMNCAELIYVRSKSSCFFNVAVSQFLLPSTMLTGQSQQQSRAVTFSMHRYWPLLIEGISRLNYKSDQNIAKILGDLIVKWAPLFKISNKSNIVAKPFIGMTNLKNLEVVEFVWGKLSKNFIALQPGRKPSSSCSMMLTVVEECMHVIEGDEQRTIAMWKNVMQHIIENAMMLEEIESTQKTSFKLLERFMKNKNFEASNAMKEIILSSLKNLSDTSLSYYSAPYFRFLNKIVKSHPKIVAALLPYIMENIKKVEIIRGSGRDVKLRNFYDQLKVQCEK